MGKDFYMGTTGEKQPEKQPGELGDWQKMAIEEDLGYIDNSYAALQAARIKKQQFEAGAVEEPDVITDPTELAKAEAAFKEQIAARIPDDLKHLCLPDFPMVPVGEKVIVKPLGQADFVVNGIVHVQTQDNPGGKCSLGIVAAMSREAHAKAPYLKVGDVVYFNPLSGSRLNLLYGGAAQDLYILWLLNIEATYYGAYNAVYGQGAVAAPEVKKDGAHLAPPPSMVDGPASTVKAMMD